MSRTARAGIAAAFGYLQFALAFVSGIVLVPFVLGRVGAQQYGVWLGLGELVAFAAMVDLGVLGVVPWLVAEREGAGDLEGARRVAAGATAVAAAAGALFAAVGVGALLLAPGITGLPATAHAGVVGPLLLLVAGTAVAYPVRTFHALLIGVQDVGFIGVTALLQVATGVGLTVALLLAGQGLYALAAGAAAPSLAIGLASWLRMRRVRPELLRGWTRPTWGEVRALAAQGLGSWSAGMGWKMVAASSGIVLLATAGPEVAVAFALTAKLGDVGMHLSWQVPDAGLVPLAQLRGEGRAEREREVVVALLRLVLLGGGLVAAGVLAIYPSFVALWVGPARFGGLGLNALLAAGVVAHSLNHGLFAAAATLGERVRVGWAALAQGVVHLGAALVLARVFGAEGVAAATLVGTALAAYPAGVYFLRRAAGLTQRDVWAHAVAPWALRAAPVLAAAAAVGVLGARSGGWLPWALAPLVAVAYVWAMRPLYEGIPLPVPVRRVLARLRLVPA
jgi:O-antigen/teichoic acid export membrane protein